MFNRTTVAKAFAAAACALAIALFTIGMDVNSTRAESDLLSAMPPTPISSEVVQPNAKKSTEPRTSRWRLAQGVPNYCGPGFTCPAEYRCLKTRTVSYGQACAWQCISIHTAGNFPNC
jgi:hypothetical protein